MNEARQKNVEIFLKKLLAKMEAGEKEHGEPVSDEKVLDEIEAELIDLVGWAFVRWERLHKLRNDK